MLPKHLRATHLLVPLACVAYTAGAIYYIDDTDPRVQYTSNGFPWMGVPNATAGGWDGTQVYNNTL
jgi:hypothetical protein